MDMKDLKKAYSILTLSGNERHIIDLLSEGRKNVTDIMIKFRTTHSMISVLVNKLYKKGYLLREKEGKEVYYSVNFDFIQRVNREIRKATRLLDFWPHNV